MRLETGCLLPENLPEAVPLLADTYWDRSSLPKVPAVFGHTNGGVIWGTLGNAGPGAVGDCTVAGVAHAVQLWRRAAFNAYPLFTDSGIKQQYFSLTGGQDSGLDPVNVANWWIKTGVQDAGNVRHIIRGYSRLSSLSDLDLACYLYGCVGLVLLLPESAKFEFRNGEPWQDTSERGLGGHYVLLCGRNSAKNWTVVTWGRVHAVTPHWLERYCYGALVYYSREYIMPSGVTPEGIKTSQLEEDLKRFE